MKKGKFFSHGGENFELLEDVGASDFIRVRLLGPGVLTWINCKKHGEWVEITAEQAAATEPEDVQNDA